MSTRSKWGEGSSTTKEEIRDDDMISMTSEMSRISFEPARHSVGRSMSLDTKVIGYKIRTVGEPIYEDKLLINLTMEICYKTTNINTNSIYIPIKVCVEGYNKYELCADIDSSCSVCFGKRTLFSEFMWKRCKNSLQVRIANNSVMSHNKAIEGLSIELGGVQCIIPVLWVLINPLMI